jgi:hypothetical protein
MKRRLKVALALLCIGGVAIWLSAFLGAPFYWYIPGIVIGIFALAYVSGDAGADRSGFGKSGDGSGGG